MVRSFSTWLALFMLLFFAAMVAAAAQYPPEARYIPLVYGIPGLALCALQLLLDMTKARGLRIFGYRFRAAPKAGSPADVIAAPATVVVPSEEAEFGPHTIRRELAMIAYFVAFVAGVLLFGFYLAVPVMLITFLRQQASASWTLALGLGIGATILMYLLFAKTLGIVLHQGYFTTVAMRSAGLW